MPEKKFVEKKFLILIFFRGRIMPASDFFNDTSIHRMDNTRVRI